MKRIALLTVLLLAIGIASGFAADPIVPIMSSVTAAVTWGVNLDTGVTGFTNTPTFTIYLPLITYGTQSSKGSGDFYGEIDLTNLELTLAFNALPVNTAPALPAQVYFTQKVNVAVDATAAEAVAAYIVAKPWNMQFGVYAAPSMALGHGIYLSQTDAVYGTLPLSGSAAVAAAANPVVPASETVAVLTSPYGVFGTYAEYGAITSTPLNIFFKVLSSGDWTGATARGYAFGVDGTATFAPLTIGFGAYQGVNNPAAIAWPGAPTQGYVTVGFAQPMGNMKIAADVKSDFSYATAFDYELSADAYLYLSAVADKDGNPQYANYVTANILWGSVTAYKNFSVHFAAVEDGTNGFVPNLGLKVEGNLVDIMSTSMAYDVIVNGSYKVAVTPKTSLTPAVAFWYGQPSTPAVAILHLIPSLTLSIGDIEKATFAVTWTGNDLIPVTGGTVMYGNVQCTATVSW